MPTRSRSLFDPDRVGRRGFQFGNVSFHHEPLDCRKDFRCRVWILESAGGQHDDDPVIFPDCAFPT